MRRPRNGLALVVAAAISSTWACSPCSQDGTLASNAIAGGTGTIVLEDVNVGMGAVQFIWEGSSPARTAAPAFELELNDGNAASGYGALLSCVGLKWSALSGASQPVPLANLCSDDGVTTRSPDLVVENGAVGNDLFVDLTPAVGTITATSTLDRNGDGTVTLQLDIPSVELVANDSSHLPHQLRVELDALRGTATFATGGGCRGGINPVP